MEASLYYKNITNQRPKWNLARVIRRTEANHYNMQIHKRLSTDSSQIHRQLTKEQYLAEKPDVHRLRLSRGPTSKHGHNNHGKDKNLNRNTAICDPESLLPMVLEGESHKRRQFFSVQRHKYSWRKRLVRICCVRKIRRKRYRSIVTLYRKMPLKAMSRLWGRFNEIELPVFLRRPLLGLYIWLFGCRLDECEVEDLKQYRNLGEFFRRQLKPGCRPINDDHVLCSPADGKILYYGKVKNGVLEQVKGVTYSLRGFLGPQTWQVAEAIDFDQISDEVYQKQLGLQPDHDLFHCIIYLAPGDYHRFHSPTHWSVAYRRHFPGELLSVNPGVARWIQGLFNFNERAVYMGKWDHGFFSMCAVGATNVGSIKIYCDEELETNTRKKHREGTFFDKSFTDIVEVDKGEMFGEFNLGSTLVLIFEAPSDFEFKIQEGQKICYGEPIGKSP